MARSSTTFKEGNLFHLLATNAGRPRIFDTPEELATRVIEYFEWSAENDKGKFTSAGLRLFCNLSRYNWRDYKAKPEFAHTLDQIEVILEDFYEKKLHWAGSTQGAIFWLKNKAGWKDESTVNENVTNLTANFGTAKKDVENPKAK